MVQMQSVASSNIDQVGYDDKSKRLYVRFRGGSLYQYDEVDKNTFDSLLKADSVGSYFSKAVKGVYAYRKVGDAALDDKEAPVRESVKDKGEIVILIDLSWLYYRSKFAFKDLSFKVEGVAYATGPIFGVYQVISDAFYWYPNADVILCLDGFPKKQMGTDQDYKSSREKQKDITMVELDRKQIAGEFTLIPQVRIAFDKSMEADDTIAFLARYYGDAGKRVVIFSGDGDMRQLIKKNVFCSTESSGHDGFVLEDADMLFKSGGKGLEGLEPQAVALYLAIVGDVGDHIEGISRYKKASAKFLANEFRTLDALKIFLESDMLESSPYKKDLLILKENMQKVEKNYILTKLDPSGIPKMYNKMREADIEFFEKYGCVKVKEGVERLIQEQKK